MEGRLMLLSSEFSVSNLKYKVQCIKWRTLPCTRQISSSLHHCRRWWKSRRSSWKIFRSPTTVFCFPRS
ncbi:hypothetical protein Godav_003709 [Gossypium davidsonii]|uniref:Uncharacterized protein n=2 Tax=Gossypium TaxID=3633 RepID=A0A7J8SIS5_GOSDV|nr:hypothetical protein [Gossypium davidsonii]MBA0661556.1 hypothetical protein [Gossypium klotzschianum]